MSPQNISSFGNNFKRLDALNTDHTIDALQFHTLFASDQVSLS